MTNCIEFTNHRAAKQDWWQVHGLFFFFPVLTCLLCIMKITVVPSSPFFSLNKVKMTPVFCRMSFKYIVILQNVAFLQGSTFYAHRLPCGHPGSSGWRPLPASPMTDCPQGSPAPGYESSKRVFKDLRMKLAISPQSPCS